MRPQTVSREHRDLTFFGPEGSFELQYHLVSIADDDREWASHGGCLYEVVADMAMLVVDYRQSYRKKANALRAIVDKLQEPKPPTFLDRVLRGIGRLLGLNEAQLQGETS